MTGLIEDGPSPEQIIRKVIVNFDWDDYGLDDVGCIKPEHADYADALAKQIVQALNRGSRA